MTTKYDNVDWTDLSVVDKLLKENHTPNTDSQWREIYDTPDECPYDGLIAGAEISEGIRKENIDPELIVRIGRHDYSSDSTSDWGTLDRIFGRSQWTDYLEVIRDWYWQENRESLEAYLDDESEFDTDSLASEIVCKLEIDRSEAKKLIADYLTITHQEHLADEAFLTERQVDEITDAVSRAVNHTEGEA